MKHIWEDMQKRCTGLLDLHTDLCRFTVHLTYGHELWVPPEGIRSRVPNLSGFWEETFHAERISGRKLIGGWAPQSSNLSPIENLWTVLTTVVRVRDTALYDTPVTKINFRYPQR